MKVWILLGAGADLAFIGFVIGIFREKPAITSGHWFLLCWLVFFAFAGVASVRGFFADREVLREGEVTAGVLTDWARVRYGVSIRYQFRTTSGQRFEGSGKVNSEQDLTENGIFPVFYLSHGPKRNVALCCTHLRIRAIGD